MYIAGLILSLAGWLFQGYETLIRKTHRINIFLPVTYCAACVLFGINSFQMDEILFGVLDILIAVIVAVIAVFLFLKR
ncbi:MAG: hypothetical protein PHF74_02775 [Dehalococcoidales bacterium]|nr:hypothetical protein [Dehalococcoidales bacterium]